jgi:hypothetical protein
VWFVTSNQYTGRFINGGTHSIVVRLVIRLFVHSGGCRQICFNFPAIPVVGIAAEHIFGHRRWLLLDFVPGVVGEIAGYASTYWGGRHNGGAGLF